jgi:hypothetical protein
MLPMAAERTDEPIVTASVPAAARIVSVHLYSGVHRYGFSVSCGSHTTTYGSSGVPAPLYS